MANKTQQKQQPCKDAFIKFYSESGNAKQSAIRSGYSEKTAEQQGAYLKKRYANEIFEKQQSMLNSLTPLAIKTLNDILNDKKVNASTKMNAVNSLLDRTGHQTVQLHKDVTNEKSTEELHKELQYLLGTIQEPDKLN
tara:strand:- start:3492 stop:3905 length:414 start_codon:yes stop_codon:yes gene_type:complete